MDDYIRQEICCREAVALGFERDDEVIRARLLQNLQIIPDQMAAQIEPTDADLRIFLDAHPDLFRSDRRWTFHQVYLNPEYHRDTLAADAARLLVQLDSAGTNVDLAKFGDPLSLEHTFQNISAMDVVAWTNGRRYSWVMASWSGCIGPPRSPSFRARKSSLAGWTTHALAAV